MTIPVVKVLKYIYISSTYCPELFKCVFLPSNPCICHSPLTKGVLNPAGTSGSLLRDCGQYPCLYLICYKVLILNITSNCAVSPAAKLISGQRALIEHLFCATLKFVLMKQEHGQCSTGYICLNFI